MLFVGNENEGSGLLSTGWHLASWGPERKEVLQFACVVKAGLHDELMMPTVALIDTACTLCMHSTGRNRRRCFR